MAWKSHWLAGLLGLVAILPARADELRLNQIQVIGTHNSYHIAPTADQLKYLGSLKKEWAESLDYTHRPLEEQFLTLAIRQIELDVYADPKGGLFSKPLLFSTAKEKGLDAGPDPNRDGVLDKPGFKVLHIPDIDYRSHVPTFTAALKQIRAWSEAHPKHLPILVLVELKSDPIPLLPTKPVKFDAELLQAIDDEILAVFGKDRLFRPDDLRQSEETLPKAITRHGWPTLASLRGKVYFALDNEGALPRLYLEKHPALRGRAMFCQTQNADDAHAAWFKINDPIKNFTTIQKLAKAGFLIRTRADESTREARANDTARRDKALASGAQFVSTDFPEPRQGWGDYSVQFADRAPARVNPVSAPKGQAIEWEPQKK